MTKLPPHGVRSPLNAYDLSEEDRSTYRRWARAWYVCFLVLLAGFVMVGSSTREPSLRTAGQSPTVRSGAVAIPARQPHPGG
jgi:hypothetical protein